MAKKLKIIAIIQARLASTRFPNKVIKKINSKTVIEIMHERLSNSKLIDAIMHDGLKDPYDNIPMGNCAEVLVNEEKYTTWSYR